MKNFLLIGTALAGLSIGTAHASPVTTVNDDMPYYQTITVNTANPGTYLVGQDVLTLQGGGTIAAWCFDLFHFINLGANTYTFDSGVFAPGATDNAGQLLTTAQINKMAGLAELGNGILQGSFLDGDNNALGLLGDKNDWSAAVQLAIWSTEYGPNYGGFSFTGGTGTTLAIYNALLGRDIVGDASSLMADSGQQSLIYTSGQTNLTAIPAPEPASMAILGAGLVGMGLIRRRTSTKV